MGRTGNWGFMKIRLIISITFILTMAFVNGSAQENDQDTKQTIVVSEWLRAGSFELQM